MAKYYYNGVLLPEIPSDVLVEYPYCWIRNNTTSGNYDLIFGKEDWYYKNTDSIGMYCHNETDEKWYTVSIATSAEATEWIFKEDTTGYFGINEPRPVMWSNHDIYQVTNSIPVIYFEATELIPEVAEDVNWYQIKASTLIGFADEARRLNGDTTLPLTPSQMLEIFENASSDGGIEDGYDVTFYDEYGEELAFFSVKQGHSVYKPSYDCIAWKTSDGTTISFPYVPTSDISVYANNDTYASQLYKFYGIDSVEYPYLIIGIWGTSCSIVFAKEIRYSSGALQTKGFKQITGSVGSAELTDYSVGNVVSVIMNKLSASNFQSIASSKGFYATSGIHKYTNFDNEEDTKATYKYRLDQVEEETELPFDGLENGYDVMFYDENNEGLAFYSIKEGHTINPPVYNCKAWQTEDGATITFPYTPSADLILYANNSTYASQLYKYYGVDSGVYPYVGVTCKSDRIGIIFGTWISFDVSNSYINFSPIVYSGYKQTTTNISDYTDIESVVSKVMELIPPSDIETISTTYALSGASGYYTYTNFENTLTTPTGKYRLDE